MKKMLWVLVIAFAVFALPVAADTVNFTLYTPNSGISAYPAPYAEVKVVSTTNGVANFTITADTTGGYTYLLGSDGLFGFNSNVANISITNIDWTGGGGSTSITFAGSGSIDGWGNFAYNFKGFDGFTSAVTGLSFTATGNFTNAASIFAPNTDGHVVAGHIFVTGNGCSGACATGYATEGNPVPEPGSMLLFGTGLLTAAGFIRRRLM